MIVRALINTILLPQKLIHAQLALKTLEAPMLEVLGKFVSVEHFETVTSRIPACSVIAISFHTAKHVMKLPGKAIR